MCIGVLDAARKVTIAVGAWISPSRLVQFGHAVYHPALAENVSGGSGLVAEFSAVLGHGAPDRLRAAFSRPPDPTLQGLEGGRPTDVERERVQQPVLGVVSRTIAAACTDFLRLW